MNLRGEVLRLVLDLLDVSDIYNFFPLGGGKGSPRRQDGGGLAFSLKIPRGGVSQEREGVDRGARRVCAGNLVGGGVFFFFGAENPTE